MDDACGSTSSLDCGTCTSNKRVRIVGRVGCVAICTSTGERCRRLSLDIKEVDMCLQHCVMRADRMSSEQRTSLLSFITAGSMTDTKKQEYELMIRARSLPSDIRKTLVGSYLIGRDVTLRKAMGRLDIAFNSIESIELLRNVYRLDTNITLLRDTMSIDAITQLDPSVPYHIWCTDAALTTDLVGMGHLTNVTVLCTTKGVFTGESFSFCHELQKIHFVLPFVTHMGDRWMDRCWMLTEVSFDLPNMKEVGDYWMSNTKIKTISFEGLPRLVSIRDHWLSDAIELEDIDFTGLGNLVSVGSSWLYGCHALESPRFYGLHRLESVGDNWMKRCVRLFGPDFHGLDALKTVGEDWMARCGHSLAYYPPDLSGMENMISIGINFMDDRPDRNHRRRKHNAFPKLESKIYVFDSDFKRTAYGGFVAR